MSRQPTSALDDAVDALPLFNGVSVFSDAGATSTAPLVQLVDKLYSTSTTTTTPGLPRFDGLPSFSFKHDSALLREPFQSTSNPTIWTRACLLADDCVGRHPRLPGHYDALTNDKHGIVLTELMTPAELAAFHAHGTLPSERRMCVLCARYNVHAAYLAARKRRSFPSNVLLNSFVNPAGEHEYDAQYLIPADGDASWSGVFGTVAGLFLNKLQLTKVDPNDRNSAWRVDQQMAHVTGGSTTCNTSTASLYRSVDARLYLLEYYRHRHRVTDAAALFLTFDELDSVRPKLDSTGFECVVPWPPTAVRSFLHRLLHYRVNRLQSMLATHGALSSPEWRYYMTIYLDSHLPMLALFLGGTVVSSWSLKDVACEHNLPDFNAFAVSAAMNLVTPPGLTAPERRAALQRSPAAIIQLLIRALPELLQVRALHTAMVRALGFRDLVGPLFRIYQCTLLGNFVACQHRPPFSVRLAFITGFTESTAQGVIKAMPPTEQLTLFVMRQYLQHAIPLCPALYDLVRSMSPVDRQRQRVADALRMVRSSPQSSDDWKAFFSLEVLEALKKSNKRLPKRKLLPRGSLDVSTSLLDSAKRAVTKRGLKRPGAGDAPFDAVYFQNVLKRRRIDDDDVFLFDGVAQGVLKQLADDPLKKAVVTISPDELDDDGVRRLYDFAAATDLSRLFRVTPLPPRVLAAQRDAVRKRFDDVEDEATALSRVDIVCCALCGVRNFTLTHAERKVVPKRACNTRACGFRKLALDVDDPSRRVCVDTHQCNRLALLSLRIVGHDAGTVPGGVLVLRDGAVVVSPCCGFVCAASSVRVTPKGWDCPACASSKQAEMMEVPEIRLCAHCQKRSALTQALQQCVFLRDNKGRVHKYGFCRAHFRTWARTTTGFLSFDFVSRNMTNRSGKGLVLNPT